MTNPYIHHPRLRHSNVLFENVYCENFKDVTVIMRHDGVQLARCSLNNSQICARASSSRVSSLSSQSRESDLIISEPWRGRAAFQRPER